jgi:hypothetical protein
MYDKNLFYTSGFISIFLYILFLLLLVFYLKAQSVKKIDPFNKVTSIELDIVIQSNTNDIQKPKDISEPQTNNENQIVANQSASIDKKVQTNVKSLFANVKTTAKKIAKEDALNVQKSTVSSRYKSKFEKQAKSSNVDVSNLLNSVQKTKSAMVFTNNKNQNDPYYSKVYEKIASSWNPRLILNDLSAKVLITIYRNGRFEYRILGYSGNNVFDTSLKEFLEEQTLLQYPQYENGSKTTIEVIFKSKE